MFHCITLKSSIFHVFHELERTKLLSPSRSICTSPSPPVSNPWCVQHQLKCHKKDKLVRVTLRNGNNFTCVFRQAYFYNMVHIYINYTIYKTYYMGQHEI